MTGAQRAIVGAFLVVSILCGSKGQTVSFSKDGAGARQSYRLANDRIAYTITTDSGRIISDRLEARPAWAGRYGGGPPPITTGADFRCEIMWTDWQAPGNINNAENPVVVGARDFVIDSGKTEDLQGGGKQLDLLMHGKDIPLLATLRYQLSPDAFYLKKRLAFSDTSEAGHFLQQISPVDARAEGKFSTLKNGGFGQPVAFRSGKGGAFFGLEYPASDNSVAVDAKGIRIRCSQEMGMKIGASPVWSDWAVEGITPDGNVKLWFMKYVNDIRVAPLSPYTLYNSWYDLRSPEYPKVPEANVMNEKNIFRIIDLIKKNMIEKHQIKLDAFVLDDGWDVYESDWVLREKEFPRGLKPISDELKKTNTGLGLWFGPTGGYSFRMKRLDWMKDHGYEVVGHTRNTEMLCLAGTKYSELFRKRTTDFVANEGVSFFKWDGIQFSCSEPGHGHPVGIYSRRAVMESLIDKVRAVREKNPETFLNITSGTWLSPWWVKYANQIWMQGADYGYADVPSISPRDAAITYRDFVLYDDFRNQNMWFPIANLMTHGIIKGNLQMLGGKAEPLDKFTNEVLLYFARGVSMWELYISPDILSEGEWDAMGEAMHWARDRFPVLSSTEMIGGDPTKGQAYGYVHFKGPRGVFAVRNPSIDAKQLRVELSPSAGLDPSASSLVLEKSYPSRWISPKLYRAGEKIDIPLDGYETAIYEVYPVAEATGPLLAGVPFDIAHSEGGIDVVTVYASPDKGKLLNSGKIATITVNGAGVRPDAFPKSRKTTPSPVKMMPGKFKGIKNDINAEFILDASVREGKLSILLTPSGESARRKPPQVHVKIDGTSDTASYEKGESASIWYTLNVAPGTHICNIRIESREEDLGWSGKASVWMICQQKQSGTDISFTPAAPFERSPEPPQPLPKSVVVKNIKLGDVNVHF